MKQTVNVHDFEQAFADIRPDQFSWDGRRALFEYLEELESDTGEEVELDVIALCCDFCEYETAVEAATEYGWTADEDEGEDEATEWLYDHTTVIPHDRGIIIQGF